MEESDDQIRVGDSYVVTKDLTIDGMLVFKKGEEVIVQGINPNPETPDFKFIVFSRRMQESYGLHRSHLIQKEHKENTPVASRETGAAQNTHIQDASETEATQRGRTVMIEQTPIPPQEPTPAPSQTLQPPPVSPNEPQIPKRGGSSPIKFIPGLFVVLIGVFLLIFGIVSSAGNPPPRKEDISSQLAAAESTYDANAEDTDSAMQQQVAVGWYTNDLLIVLNNATANSTQKTTLSVYLSIGLLLVALGGYLMLSKLLVKE